MENHSFEKAYERLEVILEKLGSGETTLDESLKLYEEADKLIGTCSGKLQSAEQKIQTLIKNRQGGLQLDAAGKPQVESFDQQHEHVVTRQFHE